MADPTPDTTRKLQAVQFICHRLFSTQREPSYTKKVLASLPIAMAGLFVNTSGTTYSKSDLMVAIASRVEHQLGLCWDEWEVLRDDATMNWPKKLTKDRINRTTEAEGAGQGAYWLARHC